MILVVVPAVILLIFYMVIMGILGENAKILDVSEDFLKLLLENRYAEAYELLAKEYQDEFFGQPLVFCYTLSVLKKMNISSLKNGGFESKKGAADSDFMVTDLIELSSAKKRMAFVQRAFPFFPWAKGEYIETHFAIPPERINRFKHYIVQILNIYPEELLSQFEVNRIVLTREGSHWKITGIYIDGQRVGNVFLDDDYYVYARDVPTDDYELADLIKIAEHLERNRIDEKNLKAFYKVISKRAGTFKSIIEDIESIELNEDDERR